MGRIRIPSNKHHYNLLNKRLTRYVGLVDNVYEKLNHDAAKIVTQTEYNGSIPFRFSDYPETAHALNNLKAEFIGNLRTIIYSGTSAEWKESNLIQDLLADKVLAKYTGYVNRQKHTQYYQTNSDALKAFQNRVDKGMNLSQKLWNQSEEYKSELEVAISTAIERGTSAVSLSKRLSKYLKDYPSLKADYKERYGEATDCHDCEYRSIRLARSEINMAYRTAEQTRWNQMDFVVGYEIRLSGSHPRHDICDDLAGKYPKDFVWTGWHPNDLCYCIPILKTEDEFWADDSEQSTTSVNEITDVPDNFKQWITDNQERIERAEKRGSLPYFVKYNVKTIDNIINPPELSTLEKARLRHEARTQEQVEKIKHRWAQREKYISYLNDPNYNNVIFNYDNGAVRATHIGHNYIHDERDNQRFFGNYTKEDMEEFCVNNLFRMGHDTTLRDEGRLLRLAKTPASLDLDLDGEIMDIATITGKHYGGTLSRKNEQLGRVKQQTGIESDCVCLYFHDPEMFSEEQFLHDVEWYKNKTSKWRVKQRIKHVYCVIKGANDILVFDI